MAEVYKPASYSTGSVGSLSTRKSDREKKSETSDGIGSSNQAAATVQSPAGGSSYIVDKDYLARLAILYGNAGKEDSTKSKSQGEGTPSEGSVERAAVARAEPESNLDKATAIAQQQLAEAAQDHDGWHEIMRQSYGDSYDYQQAEQLRQQTLASDFSWMPDVQVVSADEMNSGGGVHGGAYSADTNTIYISAELLDADPELAATVLLEEIGHSIDTLVNDSDTQGDEGEIFGRLVGGETLSESELAAIRAEDDSGTIIIGGVRVDVEYSGGIIGDLFDSIGDVFKSVGKALAAPFKVWLEVITEVWEVIKDAFMKVIMSEWMGWLVTIMSFIPVLQFVALVIQIARAVYMLYQGIKHGSIAMVLGAIASIAGGLSKLAVLANASKGVVTTLNNIAQYAGKAAAAYKALSQKDFGAAMSLLSNEFAGTELGTALDVVSRSYAVHEAVKRGDVLGAIGLGAALLESIPGDNGDEILATIAEYADTIDKVATAIETGDYSAAATLLNDTILKDLGLSEETRDHFQKAADSLEKLATAKEVLESGDYSKAAALLFDVAENYAPTEQAAAAFREAGETVTAIAEAVELIEDGKYLEALNMLGEYTDIENPAVASLLADVTAIAEVVQLVEEGKYAEALNKLDFDNPALSGLVSDLTNVAEAAQLIEDGKYTEALDKLNIDDPALTSLVSDLTNVAEAAQLIEDGKYTEALDKLNIDDPALTSLVSDLTNVAEAAQLIEDGKYTEALDKLNIDDPALTSLVSNLTNVAEAAQLIEDGKYTEALDKLNIDDPALSNLVSNLVNVAEAAQLIEDGKYTEALDKLSIDDPALSNLVSNLANIAEAAQLIEDGKYAEGLDKLNIDNPALSNLVAGLKAFAEAAQLAEDGKYSEALEKLGEIHDGELDNPALASLVADLERWVGGFERIEEAMEANNHIEAIEIMIELAEIDADSGIRAMFADVVAAYQYLLNLKSAIEIGAWSLAIEAVRELKAQASDPATYALLQKLEDELVARAAEETGQDLSRDTAAA